MIKVYAILCVHIILVLFFFNEEGIAYKMLGSYFLLEGIVFFYIGMKDIKNQRESWDQDETTKVKK